MPLQTATDRQRGEIKYVSIYTARQHAPFFYPGRPEKKRGDATSITSFFE